MKKYISLFKISFQQEFAYKINFIMWRVRNVLQIILIFFLWDSVFTDTERVVFGYNREKIITYILGLLIVRSIVTSSRSIDIAGEVSRGDLANFLLKPVSYFKYWFTRDLSSKALNLIFAFFEIVFLFVLLKPQFFIQTEFIYILLFMLSLTLSVILYFFILFLFNLFPLWNPEQAWGPSFLLFIFVEFLGGGLFPLDILPQEIQKVLYMTPFPYLIFTPLQIYLGKFNIIFSTKIIAFELAWILLMTVVVSRVWRLGLKVYSSEGR